MTTNGDSHSELDTTQRNRVDVVLQDLSSRPQTQWLSLIDELCRNDDTSVRNEIISIVDAAGDSDLDSFLTDGPEIPADLRKEMADLAGNLSHPKESIDISPPLTRIGRYTIESIIATGGMGMVYSAVQDQPQRTVAIKIMNRSLTTPDAVRRFINESQLLASLDHPNIAHVYEAGTHESNEGESGVPWFAMEFIEGALPITTYIESKSLDMQSRIDLFLTVCDAIQHGHTHGVIHRDIKPANVLVNDQGHVKVIDFGVARVTQPEHATTTMRTSIGQLIGTLQYMSPEQCRGHDVDDRSDVFSLGVLLYEILSGQPPFPVVDISLPEAVRRICEDSPTALNAHDTALRGDLETIVMKAIEKEPSRRYQSAVSLRDDLQRFLKNEPIEARPPSALYRLQKFTRRNALLVAGITVGGVAVAGGSWLTWWLNRPVAWPRPLRSATMAFNDRSGEVVLFGGFNSGRSQELWTWNGTTWREIIDPMLDTRVLSPMVFDSMRGQFILVGGTDGERFRSDALAFSEGNTDTLSLPINNMQGRAGHSIIYDSKRKCAILFGGQFEDSTNPDSFVLFNDTWILASDSSQWQDVETGSKPTSRRDVAMAYDELRDFIILFGGDVHTGVEGKPTKYIDDTWIFDPRTNSWKEKTNNSAKRPPSGSGNIMVYDSNRELPVLLCQDGTMWEWLDSNWIENQDGKHPEPRTLFAAAYDRKRGCIVFFGGQDGDDNEMNDLWEFSSKISKWVEQ